MTKIGNDIVAAIGPKDELITHLGSLHLFALNLCRNGTPADELVQEAAMKPWKLTDGDEPGTTRRGWLFTTSRNIYYTSHAKVRREVADIDDIVKDKRAVKPEHARKLPYDDFMAAFAQRPYPQREALTLIDASCIAFHAPAEICGVATGTVKGRVNRARAKLVDLFNLPTDDFLKWTASGTMAVVAAGQNV